MEQGVVVIDVRNDYETEHGTFAGAVTLPLKKFSDFPEAFERAYGDAKDRKFAFFCTGGIRCEKVVPWATARGYDATQLDGGILGYFEREGRAGYAGDCFVFDGRWLVDSSLKEAPGSDRGGPRLPPRQPMPEPSPRS